MFPQVMRALLGYIPEHEKISLPGYQRKAIRNEIYPGAFQQQGSVIEGRLWYDLDQRSLEILDLFEGDFYEHQNISISAENKGDIVARIYIVRPENLSMLSEELWDKVKFQREELQGYIQMCVEFRSAL